MGKIMLELVPASQDTSFCFRDAEVGDIFVSAYNEHHKLWMKLNDAQAVQLPSGMTYYFGADDRIRKVSATLRYSIL